MAAFASPSNTRGLMFLLGAALLLLQLLGSAQAFMVPRVLASPIVARNKVQAPAAASFAPVQQQLLLQQSSFAPVPTALLAAGDDDPETATEEAGPLGVATAGLGLVACPVVRGLLWFEMDGYVHIILRTRALK